MNRMFFRSLFFSSGSNGSEEMKHGSFPSAVVCLDSRSTSLCLHTNDPEQQDDVTELHTYSSVLFSDEGNPNLTGLKLLGRGADRRSFTSGRPVRCRLLMSSKLHNAADRRPSSPPSGHLHTSDKPSVSFSPVLFSHQPPLTADQLHSVSLPQIITVLWTRSSSSGCLIVSFCCLNTREIRGIQIKGGSKVKKRSGGWRVAGSAPCAVRLL